MSEPCHKRQRASTNGAAHPPSAVNFRPLLELLPVDTVHTLLNQAAQTHDDVADLIASEFDRRARIARAKVVDFAYLSKTAWKAINITYQGLSGSKQYDFVGEVFHTVEDCINTIKDGC